MTEYVVLLRGINVGGKNILPMKELVFILKSLGFENVSTYIQSGNIVLSSDEISPEQIATKIRQAILNDKGFEPSVLVLDSEQFQKSAQQNPFPVDSAKALHLFFLEASVDKLNLQKLNELKQANEEFELIDKVFYLYAPNGIGRSKLAGSVEKELGVSVTARNWNTVKKISSMLN